MAEPAATTVNKGEIDHFAGIAAQWWDPNGEFAPLHKLNPIRLGFIKRLIADRFDRDHQAYDALKGLSLVDIGCGGGLITEPMTRLGAKVTGLDAEPETVKVAVAHAGETGLEIDYRCGTAENLAGSGHQFDVVIALEVVEHVDGRDLFFDALSKLTKPGGLIFMSTLNRTPKGFALGIVAAEYILRWLPRGTHDWRKFMRPSEVVGQLRQRGFSLVEKTGLVYNPVSRSFSENPRDLDVNYILCARKDA
ncbi:MAG: bifunctional 2-polyprenyl-6-hydroxyphenol methylase/3-demethylubiquinol 3-O-methyltransferase UbiG [Alphaproteobacteria bacterium]|nr:bifunctional 2-polyprenyl-6-hydroxyphenol methylase/3-demethylubiquinol 3-O-methyltransferase UbiG [Alphaproteobacteria bacterium SS10]